MPDEGTPTSSLRSLPDEAHCDASSSEVKPRRDDSGVCAPSAAEPQSQQEVAQHSASASAAAEDVDLALGEHCAECHEVAEAMVRKVAGVEGLSSPAGAQAASKAEEDAQQDSIRGEIAQSSGEADAAPSECAVLQQQADQLQPATAQPSTPVPFVDRIQPGSPYSVRRAAGPSSQQSPAADAARPEAGMGGWATPEAAATPDAAAGGLFETPGFFDPMFTPAADLRRPTSARQVRRPMILPMFPS